ncbi:MAG: tetratricopeptide repeat protein [Pseudomonadota bacterium]
MPAPKKKARATLYGYASAAGLALAISLAAPQSAPANEQLVGFGESMFFSFRQATKQIAPDFDIRIWASNLEKALVAYRKGEFKRAHTLFKAAADEGDVMAHWWLGRMYKLGQGVKKNEGKSFFHFRQAALKFDGLEAPGPLMGAKLDSLVNVGQYYLQGIPAAKVRKQPKRAMHIFRTAAQFRHPGAQYGLGVMFYDGSGTAKRPRRAMKWLTLSAQKHFPLALAKLGDIYWERRKNPRNLLRAMMWYTLAQNAVTAETHPSILKRYSKMAKSVPETVLHDAHLMALRWSRKYPPPHHRIMQQPVGGTDE